MLLAPRKTTQSTESVDVSETTEIDRPYPCWKWGAEVNNAWPGCSLHSFEFCSATRWLSVRARRVQRPWHLR
ncbi:uncharacterized protein LOC119182148 isoform X3 [Rhipicephalus microplus]|uniref:uncharacterized protein LOC119182148 isoform X3 n=1 Tax=Rhipicephalus microplus TaxID=6941 RepID=UPI003F6D00FE